MFELCNFVRRDKNSPQKVKVITEWSRLVDECHIFIYSLGVQESFQGIQINSYTIYTPNSSIICGFACFERFCRIQIYKPKSQDQKMFFRPVGSKEIATKAQNDPIQEKPADQTIHQNAAFGKQTKRAGQRPPRVARGGSHSHDSQLLPRLLWFRSRLLVLPRNFSVRVAIFAFKGGCIWTPSTIPFHSFNHSPSSFFYSISQRGLEGEVEDLRKRRRIDQASKDSSKAT